MAEPGVARLRRAAARLARGRATPFYLFDARAAAANARRWQRIAGGLGTLALVYPYKCNRHPKLLDLLAREGLGAEVASRGDLEAALARGITGDGLVLQGPAKERECLDLALAAGARLVADGPEDATALVTRARALGFSPRYLLRFRAAAAERSQGSFGFRPAELLTWAREALRSGSPAPEGLAFHLGTGIASASPYRDAIREAGGLARRLRALGAPVRCLDAGGGFAARGEKRRDALGRVRPAPPTPEAMLPRLAAQIRDEIPGASALLEPGRALASDAFALVTRVVRVRDRRVYVDASRMSHAFFLPNGRHAFHPIPRRGRGPRQAIAGPLPVDLDRLSPGESVGRPRAGDLLVIGSVGAYNLIAANAWAGRLPEVLELP